MIPQRIKIIFFIFYLTIAYSNLDNTKVNRLFEILKDDDNWVNLSYNDGLQIYSKNVDSHPLAALKIESKIDLPLDIIQSIIMDIEKYDSILKSSNGLETIQIDMNDNIKVAYQFIPINIPFMSHRHYIFQIEKHDFSINYPKMLVEWYILESTSNYAKKFKKQNTIYLEDGVGIWMAKKNEENKIILSYRLYMNPGGSIPNFLMDKLNEDSIINIYKDVINESKRRLNL